MKKLAILCSFVLGSCLSDAPANENLSLTSPSTVVCSANHPAPVVQDVGDQAADFFSAPLTTTMWPARWQCGTWTPFHGWLYILSDATIALSYFLIPLILLYFIYQRRQQRPFQIVMWLFIFFILACGMTHLIDASIFWWPAYRLSALIRFLTASVSLATVFALVKVTPQLLQLKSPQALERIVKEQTEELSKQVQLINSYRQALDESSIVVITDQEGRIEHVNENFSKISGYAKQEILGKNLRLIFSEDQVDLWSTIASGVIWKGELSNRKKNNTRFWIDATFVPFLNEEGRPYQCMAMWNDITERKEKEDIILRSEQLLVEAQAVAKVGSWETDLETLQVSWSIQTYEIFELDPVSFRPTHTTFLDFVHPHDRDKVNNAFVESVQCDEDCRVEHRIITRSGQLKWLEERWRIFLDEAQKPYRAAGTCQDITERKVAEIEKALLINNTEESFIMVDNELKIISYNNQFSALYKKYFGVIIKKGNSILDYAWPASREVVKTVYDNVLTGQNEESEINLEFPGESVKTHSIKYKPARNEAEEIIGVFISTRDITEKKRSDDEIRTEKLFSDSLINSLPGVFYLYDENRRFVRWNNNFETISGYSAAEISQMHPLEFYDSDEKELVKQKIEKVFADGKDEVMANFYTKSKRKIPYYFNGHRIILNGKKYLIGVGIDVTESAQAQHELITYSQEIKKLTSYLEEVREEERTRIAREIHDELGQQLTGLKMDTSWLCKRINSSDKLVHEKLSGMISLLDHTVKTIRRISTDLRPGILDDLGLVAALEWQCSEFSRQTELTCSFNTQIQDVNFERNLSTTIFRIFQESLTNIMRHSRASKVDVFLTQTDEEIMLTVADNGQGFDVAEVKEKGTLGLIGIRERAISVGATVQILSEKGVGTRVILKIPVALVLPTS